MKPDFFNRDKEELRGGLKKIFSPSRDFSARAKKDFLAAFDVRYHAAPASRFVFAVKVFAGAMAVAVIFLGGASVYADTKNVPADSPLYPLKRLDESVQLAVVPASEKAQLQAVFAGRRMTELNDLQGRKPSSTIIAKLAADAGKEVTASIADSESAGIQDGKLVLLCNRLLSEVVSSTSTFQGEFSGNTVLGRFANRCEDAKEGDLQRTSDRNATTFYASTTAVASATIEGAVSSSFVAPTGTFDLETRIQRFLGRRTPSSTTTQSGAATGTASSTPVRFRVGPLNRFRGGL